MPVRVLVDTRKLNAPRLAVAAPGLAAGEAGPPSLESFGKRRTAKTPRLETTPRKLCEALVEASGKLLASAKKKALAAPELDVLLRNKKRLQAALK